MAMNNKRQTTADGVPPRRNRDTADRSPAEISVGAFFRAGETGRTGHPVPAQNDAAEGLADGQW